MFVQRARSRKHKRSATAHLEEELHRAIDRAKGWDFDLPGTAARERALEVFDRLAKSGLDLTHIRVNVAVDGAIALARSNEHLTATVEIEPLTAQLSMVVTDERERIVVGTWTEPELSDILGQLERAA